MSLPLFNAADPVFNTVRGVRPSRQRLVQVIRRVDEGTVDGVVNHLRQIDKDPTVLQALPNWTAPLLALLEEVPPDDRAATCLTAVSLLSEDPELAVRWARWWACIAISNGRRDFEAGLWLALARWCSGDATQAARDLLELTGSEAPVNQARFGLALAFLILGETDHLPSYHKAIAAEDPALAELLSKLERSIQGGGDRISKGREWAMEWCGGRLLWFVGSSIFAPLVVTEADSDSPATG